MIKILDDDIDRDKLMQELRKFNIGTNLHFYPVHKNIFYERKYPEVVLPVSEWLMNRILTLPLCTKYSVEDLEYVKASLDHIYENKLANKTVFV